MYINLLWKLLHIIILIIVSYLGVLKYHLKKKKMIKNWNYISILVFTILIILAQLNCLRYKEIMCQVIPLMLFIPLFIFYMIYLIDTKDKYNKDEKIIKSLMLFSILSYLIVYKFS